MYSLFLSHSRVPLYINRLTAQWSPLERVARWSAFTAGLPEPKPKKKYCDLKHVLTPNEVANAVKAKRVYKMAVAMKAKMTPEEQIELLFPDPEPDGRTWKRLRPANPDRKGRGTQGALLWEIYDFEREILSADDFEDDDLKKLLYLPVSPTDDLAESDEATRRWNARSESKRRYE